MNQPPPIGQKIIKSWGETTPLVDEPYHDEWHAVAVRGGYSSRHYHPHKANEFRVISGVLRIEEWYSDKPTGRPVVTTEIRAGGRYRVNKNVWHRFVAVTAVEMTEVYTHDAGVPLLDIVRYDEGGVDVSLCDPPDDPGG